MVGVEIVRIYDRNGFYHILGYKFRAYYVQEDKYDAYNIHGTPHTPRYSEDDIDGYRHYYQEEIYHFAASHIRDNQQWNGENNHKRND
jgi:hypothetical protein